jgi:hypothetical protein
MFSACDAYFGEFICVALLPYMNRFDSYWRSSRTVNQSLVGNRIAPTYQMYKNNLRILMRFLLNFTF